MTITSTYIQKRRNQARGEAKESLLSHSQLLEKYAQEDGFKNWKDLLAHQSAQPSGSATLLAKFRDRLLDPAARRNFKRTMVIDREDRISVCYAAFEHVNRAAKIVLVGLTPGEQQAVKANETVAKQLAAGASDQDALKAAKVFASFSGPMKPNLVALLDYIGIPEKLGITSSEQLFGERSDLCHFTSALRYPVFIEDKNYSGSPSILKHSLLRKMVDDHLASELSPFGSAAWYVPLGRESSLALGYLAEQGIIPEEKILNGLPHPSGANAERISYFLGRKNRESLSGKTNAVALDTAKRQVMEKMNKEKFMDKIGEGNLGHSTDEERQTKVSKDNVMPPILENRIASLAKEIGMTVIDGTGARHELEIRFKNLGREESLYINRKAYWHKDMLKIALRPELSGGVSDSILRSNCANPLILKGDQREAYSRSYRAFDNRRFAKGSKDEHFGQAWIVDISDSFSKLKQFLEILSMPN